MRHRTGHVIGRHEKRAEHDAAGQQMEQRSRRDTRRYLVHDPDENRHGQQDRQRDIKPDQSEQEQTRRTDQDRQCAGFAQTAADVPDKRIPQKFIGVIQIQTRLLRRTLRGSGQRRRCGHPVQMLKRGRQRRPGGHRPGRADQQRHPRDRGRIERILAEPAEHLFGDDDCHK